jgi:hypothetical protein
MSIENYKEKIATLEQKGNIEALKQMKSKLEDPVAEFAQQAIDRLLKQKKEGGLSQNYTENKVGNEKAAQLTEEIDKEIDQLDLDMQQEIKHIMNDGENLEDTLGLEKNDELDKKELSLEEIRNLSKQLKGVLEARGHTASVEQESIENMSLKEVRARSKKLMDALEKWGTEPYDLKLSGKSPEGYTQEQWESVSSPKIDLLVETFRVLTLQKELEVQEVKTQYYGSEGFKKIEEQEKSRRQTLEQEISDKETVVHAMHKLRIENPEDDTLKFFMRKYHLSRYYFFNLFVRVISLIFLFI